MELDLYMFEQVCKLVEKWHASGYPKIPVSVNMSRGHFSVPGFFKRYQQILERYNIPGNAIGMPACFVPLMILEAVIPH